MKITTLLTLIIFGITTISGQTIPDESLYFGQTPPGSIPEEFAPAFITGYKHGPVCISPNGDEIYWVINPSTERIVYSKLTGGIWSTPALASFVTNYLSVYNGGPTLTPDGDKLFFYSTRAGGKANLDAWYVEKTGNDWTNALNVPVAGFMTMFSNTNHAYMVNYGELTRYDYSDEQFSNPVSMNTYDEFGPFWTLCVSPDDSYLICAGNEPPDLFVCFKNNEGDWDSPVKFESTVNTSDWERFPSISPDGKYMFFIRGNNTSNKVFWVSTSIIDELRNDVRSIDNLLLSKVKIYPNPASQTIYVNLPESLKRNVKYQIISQDGKIIKQCLLTTTKIEVSELKKGTYILKFDTRNGVIEKQIVIN